MEREALQRLVVEAKYESVWGRLCSNAVYGSYGMGVWQNIRRGWGDFSRFVRYGVGDELKIWFWHDVWCGDRTLKEAFPTL